MMSGHGPNLNFFNNEKIKIGRPEHSLTPQPLTSDNISFFPYHYPSPPNHLPALKVDVICVSLFII